ncbi:MAG: hypothetical protein WBM07_03480, partial [Chitinivibrionales bacterium]
AEARENLWHEKWSEPEDVYSDTGRDYNDIKLRLSMGLLLGDRVRQFENVLGNWDGFYSNVLGSHQILNTVTIEAIPKETIKSSFQEESLSPMAGDSSFSYASIDQNARYGFINHFEIGEEFSAAVQSYSAPVYDLGLQLSMNTVPLRNYGPAAASNQEYFLGMRLKQGECHGFIRYSPPIFKQELSYEFVPILERIGTIGGLSTIGTPGGNSSLEGIARLVASSNQTILNDPEFALRFSWGVSDWLTFSNDLEIDNIDYKPAPQQSVSIQSGVQSGQVMVQYPLISSQLNTPTNNSIFANVTALTFHLGDARRLSIAAFYAQQKENSVETENGYPVIQSRSDLENFMLFVLYQVAIPYETFSKGLNKVQSASEVK